MYAYNAITTDSNNKAALYIWSNLLCYVRLNTKFGVNEQVAEIKNRLRDQTAEMYPNADTVSHSDLNINVWGQPDANITGTAFDCFD